MNPPSTHKQPSLRAPLLWMFIPWSLGYLIAFQWPPIGDHQYTLRIIALALTVLMTVMIGIGNQLWDHTQWIWQISFFLTAVAVGIGWWNAFLKPTEEALFWANCPPREMIFEFNIQKIHQFQRESCSGYWQFDGKVINASFPFPSQPLPKIVKAEVYLESNQQPIVEGNLIKIRGVLDPPQERIDGHFFVRDGNLIQCLSANKKWHIDQIKRRLLKRMLNALSLGSPEETFYSGYLQAMLTGDKSFLGKPEKGLIKDAGVMHFFAVSGFHLTVVGVICLSMLQLLGLRQKNAVVGMLLLCGIYVWITGSAISAQRALLMMTTYSFARVVRRRPDALAATIAAALILLICKPTQLFTPGYQLSFVVVIAIITQAIPLHRWLTESPRNPIEPEQKNKTRLRNIGHLLVRYFMGSFAISWTAFWVSAPIIIAHFGSVNMISFLINTLLMPLFAIIMVSGFLSAFAGIFGCWFVSEFLNHASWILLSIIEKTLGLGLKLPTTWQLDTTPVFSGIVVTTLLSIGCLMDLKDSRNRHWLLATPILSFSFMLISSLVFAT